MGCSTNWRSGSRIIDLQVMWSANAVKTHTGTPCAAAQTALFCYSPPGTVYTSAGRNEAAIEALLNLGNGAEAIRGNKWKQRFAPPDLSAKPSGSRAACDPMRGANLRGRASVHDVLFQGQRGSARTSSAEANRGVCVNGPCTPMAWHGKSWE